MNEDTSVKPPEEANAFTRHFENAVRAFRERLSEHRLSMAREDGKRSADLMRKSAEGQRARAFLSSKFFQEDVQAWMAEQEAAAMKPWRPGLPADEADIRARYLFASGRATMNEDFVSWLKFKVEEGESAERALSVARAQRPRG